MYLLRTLDARCRFLPDVLRRFFAAAGLTAACLAAVGLSTDSMVSLEACLVQQSAATAEAIAARVHGLLQVAGAVREGQLLDLSSDEALQQVGEV